MIGDEYEIALERGRERARTVYTITTDDPEEVKLHLNANTYRSVLWELVWNKIRNELKHCEPSEDRRKAFEEIREFVMEELDGVELE